MRLTKIILKAVGAALTALFFLSHTNICQTAPEDYLSGIRQNGGL